MARGRITRLLPLLAVLIGVLPARAQILTGVLDAQPGNNIGLEASCAGSGTSSALGCSAAMLVSAGDAIVCSASQHSYGTVGFYVADNLNGVYTAVGNVFLGDSGHYGAYWVLFNSAAGAITPTVIASGSVNGLTLTCNAWRNAALSAGIDPAATQFNPTGGTGIMGANPTAGPAPVLSAADEAIDCTMWNLNGTAPAAAGGFKLTPGANASGIYQWPEYGVASTLTAFNCPYSAATDTWTDFSVGLLSKNDSSGGVAPFTGVFTDGHGATDGTPVSVDNLNAASYGSVYGGWSACQNITSMQWSASTGIPNRLHPLWVNGTNAAGNTGMAITHSNAADVESCQIEVYSNPGSGEAELSIDQQLAGYTNDFDGDICDTARIANSVTGDTETIQWFYDTSVFHGPAIRLEDNDGSTHASVGIALPNFSDWYSMRLRLGQRATTLTFTSAAEASDGKTIYTGNITGGANNGLAGQWFTVSGFSNPANNNQIPSGSPAVALPNGWAVIASTATTLTLANPAGVAEVHAGTAVIDHILEVWDATTGAYVGTDSSPVQVSAAPTGWITVNVGGQGSCGMNQPGSITNYGYIAVNPLTTTANFPTPQ